MPSSHPFHETRKTVYAPPDQELFLANEARAHLNKMLPRIQEENFANRSISSEFKNGWAIRSGYLSWLASDPRLVPLSSAVSEFFGQDCRCSGHFLYPRNGFRSWHTNKYDKPGWHMFLVDTDAPGESFFRYLDPVSGEMVTHWDEPGDINIFRIDADELFWHCIVSEDGNRWSQGFTLPENWHEKVL